MSNLIGLFENIQVKVDDLIEPEDLTFCETLFEEYTRLVAQLNAYLDGIKELDKHLPQLNPAELDDKSSYIWVNYSSATSWIQPLSFTSVHSRKYINGALRKALYHFNKSIVSHFKFKYNLPIDVDKYSFGVEFTKAADWKKLVLQITNVSGGSLIDAGILSLKNGFMDKFVRGEFNLPEIKNDTIILLSTHIAGFSDSHLSLGNLRVTLLLQALAYFETEELEIPEFIKKSFPLSAKDKIEFSKLRNSDPRCKRFSGFRFFKNGRLDLKFVSPAAAREFYGTFVEG